MNLVVSGRNEQIEIGLVCVSRFDHEPPVILLNTQADGSRIGQRQLAVLKRFARLRAHERGSAEERAEIEKVKAEIRRDMKEYRPCWEDFRIGTQETLAVLGRGDPGLFERKLSGVFTYPEASVRRMVSEALAAYVTSPHADDLSEEQSLFLEERVAGLLDDEVLEVREAAAAALFQFEGREVPEQRGEPLVTAARELWSDRQAIAQ
jgi:hypothetical protein